MVHFLLVQVRSLLRCDEIAFTNNFFPSKGERVFPSYEVPGRLISSPIGTRKLFTELAVIQNFKNRDSNTH